MAPPLLWHSLLSQRLAESWPHGREGKYHFKHLNIPCIRRYSSPLTKTQGERSQNKKINRCWVAKDSKNCNLNYSDCLDQWFSALICITNLWSLLRLLGPGPTVSQSWDSSALWWLSHLPSEGHSAVCPFTCRWWFGYLPIHLLIPLWLFTPIDGRLAIADKVSGNLCIYKSVWACFTGSVSWSGSSG